MSNIKTRVVILNNILRFLPIVVIFLFSCDPNNSIQPQPALNPIPNVAVNTTINMDLPLYAELNHQGGSDTLDFVGYKGIIVVHDFNDEFWAYDRTCPYHINSDCGKVTMGSLKLVCGHYDSKKVFHPCCDSQYSLDGGNVIHGPTTYGLRIYNITQNGQILTITN